MHISEEGYLTFQLNINIDHVSLFVMVMLGYITTIYYHNSALAPLKYCNLLKKTKTKNISVLCNAAIQLFPLFSPSWFH